MPSLSSTSRSLNGKHPRMRYLHRPSTRRSKNRASAKETRMSMRRTLFLALACVVLSQALHGQEQSPAILKEFDRAIDQVAERAMQSVVEIEVTGYGVPESDKDQGQQGQQGQQQTLERQRSLGSGVI